MTHTKFLQFNGKNIVFLSVNGTYWVAIKPICEALNIDYIRQFKNLKEHQKLSQLLSEQTMVATDKKMRKMICLPEKYIYGWIFSLNSDSEELWEYKLTCYDILYNHFHGIITNRKELLLNKMDVDTKIHNIKEELKESEGKYLELQELEIQRKAINKDLKAIDVELIEQPKLF
ncbi:MAG: phage antirepressor N-terminal domain-containing protein [Brumimicrobium sp.]|nr:phage antirepressor N-terminal domain-containing protein [Brumimicrobium sp.]